ncbi:MAG: alpha/beta hydrolase [Christensenellales bacterium]
MDKNRITNKKLYIAGSIAFVIIYVLLFPTIIFPLMTTALLYEALFGSRCQKTRKILTDDDFPDMQRKEVRIPSGKNMLNGGIFVSKSKQCDKALIVLGHGIGCSMGNYLNRVNYFVGKGYTVLAYDITGCGDSEGANIKGLPQSQIDMVNVVRYALECDELKGLPILLYGHSWSGYGTATALNHDVIKDNVVAAATLSGFNTPWDIIYYQGYAFVGNFIMLTKPWMSLYQYIKFGKASRYSGIQGINNFDKPVLCVHSSDDPTVNISSSVYSAKEQCSNQQAKFVLYDDRGHTLSRPIESERRIGEDCKDRQCSWKEKGNIFVYKVDMHYEWSSKEDINAIDTQFMDTVDEFYSNVLNNCRNVK